MKKNRWALRLALLLLLLLSYCALVVGVTAAGTAGSESDPLVTLSYLNDTFLSRIMEMVDRRLAERESVLSDKLATQVAQDMQTLAEQYGTPSGAQSDGGVAPTFVVVTMEQGQTLYGDIGCEVMLRVGTAKCVSPSSPGLIDETDASVLEGGGQLVKNHLYMMTITDRGVRATAATTKLLVRGGYSVS